MGSINTDFAVWIRVVCGGLGFGLRGGFGWFSAWWLGFWGFAEFTFGWCDGVYCLVCVGLFSCQLAVLALRWFLVLL